MEYKRDFDPNVGGGVDRDKLNDSDFAGKNRSFPIVKPSDVSDALQSIGQAGPDNYSHDVLKANIHRIAKRKGFAVPDESKSWDLFDSLRGNSAGREADKFAKSDPTWTHKGDGHLTKQTSGGSFLRVSPAGHSGWGYSASHMNGGQSGFAPTAESAARSAESSGDFLEHSSEWADDEKSAPANYGKKAGFQVQTKAWVNLAGSYEQTQALLDKAVDTWLDQAFPGMMVNGWIEATYPAYALVGVSSCDMDMDPSEATCCEYWKVPYSVDDDSSVTLGDPSPVDIRGVAVDRPDDDGDVIDFLPGANVAAKALAYKGATRLRRRYALLAYNGVDISASGLTPQELMYAPEGLRNIPREADPSWMTGQSDLSQPGTVSDMPSTMGVPQQGYYNSNPGTDSTVNMPSWFQGTWYVDNQSNLVPVNVPGSVVNQPAGNMTASMLPGQGYYDANPGNVNAPAMNGVVGTTTDAGTMTLAGTPRGETKGFTYNRPKGKLINLLKNQKFQVHGTPMGLGGGKAATGPVEAKFLQAAPEVFEAVSNMSIAVKAGRMMSGANMDQVRDAHSKLTDALSRAGVINLYGPPTNAEAGDDEDGNRIPVSEAKSDTEAIMEWKRLRAERKTGLDEMGSAQAAIAGLNHGGDSDVQRHLNMAHVAAGNKNAGETTSNLETAMDFALRRHDTDGAAAIRAVLAKLKSPAEGPSAPYQIGPSGRPLA